LKEFFLNTRYHLQGAYLLFSTIIVSLCYIIVQLWGYLRWRTKTVGGNY